MSLNKQLDKLFESSFKNVDEEEIDEANVTGAGEIYNTPNAFGKEEDENNNAELLGYKKVKTESVFKSISKQIHLGEATYKQYKTDESLTSRQKVNKSIKEVNGKLFRIERILDQNMKLKTESGIDESKYWESTKRNLLKIEGKMIRLAEKLRSF
tara:strand:+ start:23 stop:487 length:465 start_codon:yes stop_codon:yes gene_type:complete